MEWEPFYQQKKAEREEKERAGLLSQIGSSDASTAVVSGVEAIISKDVRLSAIMKEFYSLLFFLNTLLHFTSSKDSSKFTLWAWRAGWVGLTADAIMLFLYIVHFILQEFAGKSLGSWGTWIVNLIDDIVDAALGTLAFIMLKWHNHDNAEASFWISALTQILNTVVKIGKHIFEKICTTCCCKKRRS